MSRAYPTSPIVGVGVLIWRARQLLLARRGKPPAQGQWSIPGGKVELGEPVAVAAMREAAEECGVQIGEPMLLTVVDLIERDEASDVRYHYVLVELLAPWVAGEPRADADVDEVRWISRQELDALELRSEMRRVLELAFSVLEA